MLNLVKKWSHWQLLSGLSFVRYVDVSYFWLNRTQLLIHEHLDSALKLISIETTLHWFWFEAVISSSAQQSIFLFQNDLRHQLLDLKMPSNLALRYFSWPVILNNRKLIDVRITFSSQRLWHCDRLTTVQATHASYITASLEQSAELALCLTSRNNQYRLHRS